MNKTLMLVCAVVLGGCGGSDAPTSPVSDSVIEVVVATTGVHFDADGYTVQVDAQATQAVAPIATYRVSVAAGSHTITLGGVSENCSVANGTSRTATTGTTASVVVTFAVTCTEVPLELVFASTRSGDFDVLNMKSSGASPHVRVAGGPAHLVNVSSDGKRIVFVSGRAGNPDLFRVNADGSDLKNLTQNSFTDANPGFSPDGSRIVFMSDRDGQADIFMMNVDGTGAVNLTRSTVSENEPNWCRNDRIVYTRSDAPRKVDLYTMRSDGSDVRRLTFDDVIVNTPRWSPDCARIAFSSTRHAGPNGDARNDLDLYVINADGTGLQRLTTTPGFDITPAWSPDGRRIAFSSERDGNSEVYVMDADGSNATNLTRNPANDQSPFWVR